MEKVKMQIVGTVEKEISKCPHCGGEPNVTVEIGSKAFINDKVNVQVVNCPYCGLSATLCVWEKICDQIAAPLADEATMPDLEEIMRRR